MTVTDALQTYKTKKKTVFAGALAAGLLAFGLGTSEVAGATSYGGYGHGGGHGYSSGHNNSVDAEYSEERSYAEKVSYTLKYSCAYSDYFQQDHYGKWHKWAYNVHTGTWFNCDFYENFEYSQSAHQAKKASYSADSSHWNKRDW